jgi:hypothetical protein
MLTRELIVPVLRSISSKPNPFDDIDYQYHLM